MVVYIVHEKDLSDGEEDTICVVSTLEYAEEAIDNYYGSSHKQGKIKNSWGLSNEVSRRSLRMDFPNGEESNIMVYVSTFVLDGIIQK